MKDKLLLEYAPDSDRCRWLLYFDSGQPQLPAQTGTLDDFFASEAASGSAERLLVLDTPQLSVRQLEFQPQERRHIQKTAPFELEESLVSDLDSLHFAFAKPGEDSVSVAVVEKSLLETLLARFDEQGVEVSAVLPMMQILQEQDDCWLVNASEDGITARLAGGRYFVSQFQQARLAWDIAARAEQQLPQRIQVYTDSQAATEQLEDSLPAALAGLLRSENKPWFADSQWAQLKTGAINLLQGEFSPSIAWAKIWQYWKLPAALFGGVLLVYTLAAYLDHRRLEAENISLRQQMMAVYQEAFPNSQVSNPEAQMRSQLAKFRGGGEPSRFLPLFYKAAQTLANYKGASLLNVNFDSRNNELRIDMLAKQFQDIEKIQTALASAGITAELVSSNSVDGGERARMKFREQK